MDSTPSRLPLRWLMLGVPALIVVGASVWAVASIMIEAAAGSQPGDFFFPIREQALQVQLSLSTDPERRADIVLQMSATPLPAFGSIVSTGDEIESSTPSADDRAAYDDPTAGVTAIVAASRTPEPLEPSQTPSNEPGSNSGPSPSDTLEPTHTAEPTREPSRTVEPSRTAEPTRTQEPSRTTEPTRTLEPSRTSQPTQTPSGQSGGGSGGPGPGPGGAGPTETPRPEDVTIQGTLESTGGNWVVAGQSFQVNGGTEIRGDPQVGSTVEVRALRYWDGTAIAYRIEKK